MNELPNTEAEAKVALYAAMRRGTDPRWGAEPVEPVKPSRRFWRWAVLGFAIGFPIGVLIELIERIMT